MARHLGIAAGLLTLCLAGAAVADEADRSALDDYAIWADGALESLPEGVELMEPLAQQLVTLTTERRREAGLAELARDPELLPAAQAHATDLLERNYVGHVTPDGLDPADRVALLHRRLVGRVGENLVEQEGLSAEQLEGQIGPLAARIMDGLMNSAGHRENILDPAYTHLAIAAAAKGQAVVVVQLFEARRALLAAPIPLHVSPGEGLPLRFEQGKNLTQPAQYAYARPGQSAQELVTLDLSIDEVSVDPGPWLLKFLFPAGEEGRFEVADGPAVVVRAGAPGG